MIHIKANLLSSRNLKRFMELRDLDLPYIELTKEKAELLIANKGEKLVDCHFQDPQCYFLIQGSVECQATVLSRTKIDETSPAANKMLNHQLPKGGSIFANSDSTVLMAVKRRDISQSRVFNNTPLTQSSSAYQIDEMSPAVSTENVSADWMSNMLGSPLFRHLDPGRIRRLFASFEEIPYKAETPIIKQGEFDEYFFVIKSGKAQVRFELPASQPDIILNEGSFFGEGAIVGETVHSASITMKTDGTICRITASQFNELIRDVLLKFCSRNEVPADGLIFDVRLPVEYRHGHTANSINIPIHTLRNRLREKPYHSSPCWIEHGSDKRSQLAALILLEHGYTAYLITE